MILAKNIQQMLIGNEELPEFFVRENGKLYTRSNKIKIVVGKKNKITKLHPVTITMLYGDKIMSEKMFHNLGLGDELILGGFEAISEVEITSG